MTTTWLEQLVSAMMAAGDLSPIVAMSPDKESFQAAFDNDFGGTEGPAVLAWSEQRVYFPVAYDGAEWMASAPRNPQSTGQEHVGGG